MNPNFLFLNRGDGTFEDATESSGAAYDEKGQAQSGMGVDAEDVNGDGLPDLLVTNFANEYNTLHLNLVNGLFMDATAFYGLAADTMPFVGWGTALADFDNDGWPDNFVANGHVDDNRRELGQPYRVRGAAAALPQPEGEAVPPGDPRRRAVLQRRSRRPRRGVRRRRQRRRRRHRRQSQGRRAGPAAQRHEVRQPLDPARAAGDPEQPRRDRHPRPGRGGRPDDRPATQGGIQPRVVE